MKRIKEFWGDWYPIIIGATVTASVIIFTVAIMVITHIEGKQIEQRAEQRRQADTRIVDKETGVVLERIIDKDTNVVCYIYAREYHSGSSMQCVYIKGLHLFGSRKDGEQ